MAEPGGRVSATPAALAMLRQLSDIHGPLMIHQSGGCCDGSSPMCYPRDEFLVGDRDVLLGIVGADGTGSDKTGTEAGGAEAGDDEAGDEPSAAGADAALPGGGVPVYIGGAQFDYWAHTHLTIDLVRGRGAGFSLEAPEGYRFLTRSRLFTDEEVAAHKSAGPPRRGPA